MVVSHHVVAEDLNSRPLGEQSALPTSKPSFAAVDVSTQHLEKSRQLPALALFFSNFPVVALFFSNFPVGPAPSCLSSVLQEVHYCKNLISLECTQNLENIYDTCCTPCLAFSDLTDLTVQYKNDKSRDYMHPDQTSEVAVAVEAAGAESQDITSDSPAVENTVLLVANLNPEKATPQSLFILLDAYGNVQWEKILYKKKENALVQMSDGSLAELALRHLNGHQLHGKSLRIVLSKHQSMKLPWEGKEDQDLTKDCQIPTAPI
ncbi:hypothetical protein STEG23_026130 [Scotinomys teguina]